MYIDNHAVLKRALVAIICTSCEKPTMEDPPRASSGSWHGAAALVTIALVLCAAVWFWSNRAPDPGPAHRIPHANPQNGGAQCGSGNSTTDVHYYNKRYALHVRNRHKTARYVVVQLDPNGSDIMLAALGFPSVTKNDKGLTLEPPNTTTGYIKTDKLTIFAKIQPCGSFNIPLNRVNSASMWSVSVDDASTPKQRYFLLTAPYGSQFEVTVGKDADTSPPYSEVNFDKTFIHGITEDASMHFISKQDPSDSESNAGKQISDIADKVLKLDSIDWTKASPVTLEQMCRDHGGWLAVNDDTDAQNGTFIPTLPSDIYILGQKGDPKRDCISCPDDETQTGRLRIAKQHTCRTTMLEMDLPYCTFLGKLRKAGEPVGYCWTYGELECTTDECGYPFNFDVSRDAGDMGISTDSYNFLKSKNIENGGDNTYKTACKLPDGIQNDPGLSCPKDGCTSTGVDLQEIEPGGGAIVIDMYDIDEVENIRQKKKQEAIKKSAGDLNYNGGVCGAVRC